MKLFLISPPTLVLLVLLLQSNDIFAFSPLYHHHPACTSFRTRSCSSLLTKKVDSLTPLYTSECENDGESKTTALPPASWTDTFSALPPATTSSSKSIEEEMLAATASSASTAVMTSQETRRALIEELGYKRKDVDRMKFELGPAIVSKRIACPPEGMPESWCRDERELDMMKKLEQESKYPLKLPLWAVSLVLLGKGLGDAGITLIKVNRAFPGASLADEFMGVPVLAIDVLCILLGVSLGWWTWNTMNDD
jgi:hypothetical protein